MRRTTKIEFKPPSNFRPSNEGNTAQQWTDWKQEFELYLTATDKEAATGKQKVAMLLCSMGKQFIKIFNNFEYDETTRESKDDLATVLKKFVKHFEPQKSLKKYVTQFQQRRQQSHETVAEYITALQELASHCEFGTLEKRQIAIQLSNGVRDEKLREKLRNDDLTLEEAINKCLRFEQSQETHKLCSDDAQVHAIWGHGRGRTRSRFRGRIRSCGRGRGDSGQRTAQHTAQTDFNRGRPSRGRGGQWAFSRGGIYTVCGNCSMHHGRGKCLAYNRTCDFCDSYSHFANSCRKRKWIMQIQTTEYQGDYETVDYEGNPAGQDIPWEQQNDVFDDFDSAQFETLNIYITTSGDMGEKRDKDIWSVKMYTQDDDVTFRIDTQAECTVMSKLPYDRLKNKPKLQPSEVRIFGYGGGCVHSMGQIKLPVGYKGKAHLIVCEIIDRKVPNLLSDKDSVRLQLVKRVNAHNTHHTQNDSHAHRQHSQNDTHARTQRIPTDANAGTQHI